MGKKHRKLNKKLEETRQRYRLCREALCSKIKPGDEPEIRDVLSHAEIKDAKRLFSRWLKLSRRLGKTWYEESNAFAKLSWAIETDPNQGD